MKDLLKLSKSECFIHTRAQYLYTFEISVNAQRDLIASGGRAEIVAQTNALQMPVWVFHISYVWQVVVDCNLWSASGLHIRVDRPSKHPSRVSG
jgi:hypothetical protein